MKCSYLFCIVNNETPLYTTYSSHDWALAVGATLVIAPYYGDMMAVLGLMLLDLNNSNICLFLNWDKLVEGSSRWILNKLQSCGKSQDPTGSHSSLTAIKLNPCCQLFFPLRWMPGVNINSWLKIKMRAITFLQFRRQHNPKCIRLL